VIKPVVIAPKVKKKKKTTNLHGEDLVAIYRNAFRSDSITAVELSERTGRNLGGVKHMLYKYLRLGFVKLDGTKCRGHSAGRPEQLWRWK
jgi:hypothetical protein